MPPAAFVLAYHAHISAHGAVANTQITSAEVAIPRPPPFTPARLRPLRTPFDDPKVLFELKYDGFRAVVHLYPGGCELVSRSGKVYRCFPKLVRTLAFLNRSAVLDGEIVVLDDDGRPDLRALQQRRGDPVLCVFDCLSLDGLDLRTLPLAERKRRLKRLVRGHPAILFAGHVERYGTALFRTVCAHNLEGIVAKRKDGAYGQDWFKIRNTGYSPLRR
jgi:bifunctional non-homologous end joining protein LigD